MRKHLHVGIKDSTFVKRKEYRIDMNYLEYKGYKGTVEYSSEDDYLFGKVIGIHRDLITYQGKTVPELRADFEAGIDSHLEACRADGVEPYMLSSNKVIKSEKEYQDFRTDLEIIITKGTTLGGMELLSEEDKIKFVSLSHAINEYEAIYHPLPGKEPASFDLQEKSMIIKSEKEFRDYQADLEIIIAKGTKLGSMELLPKEDLDEMDRLAAAIEEYETVHYTL